MSSENERKDTEKTRVSREVVDTLSLIAAREVPGVEDIDGLLVTGAIVGGFFGSAIGFIRSDPIGATVGMALGSAAGAAAVRSARRFAGTRKMFEVGSDDLPSVHMRLTVREGTDLDQLVSSVKDQVRRLVERHTDLELGDVDIVISRVVGSS